MYWLIIPEIPFALCLNYVLGYVLGTNLFESLLRGCLGPRLVVS